MKAAAEANAAQSAGTPMPIGDERTTDAPAGRAAPATVEQVGIADPPLPFTGGRFPATDEERAFVERRVMLQFFVAPALALAALLAGLNLGWPRLTAIGVLGLGLAALLVGWSAITERRLMFMRSGARIPRERRYFIYEGLAAVPYGIALVVLAGALITPASLHFSGTSLGGMRAVVLARPGLALAPLGLLFLFHGLGFLIGFGRRATSFADRLWIALLHLPARLGALILLAWALALLAIGLVEIASPALFQQKFESIFGNPWPFRAT